MLIQRQLIPIKSSYSMFLLILLCASVMESWEYRKTAEEVFLTQLVDPVTGQIDEDMAELLWISCWLDFINLKESNEDLNLIFLEETSFMGSESKSECRSQAKEHIWKMIKIQHPQLKQTLIDCTRKNNIMFPVSGEGGSNIQHTYHDSLFTRHVVPKRNLLQGVTEAPPPAIGSTFPSLAPSPELVLSPVSAPNPAPSPSPRKSFFPTQGGDSPPPPLMENSSAGPFSGPDVKPDSSKSKDKKIVTAVVVTAVVTFALAALFFYCYTKFCRIGPGVRQNDDRPLLSVSLSDYSTGSAYRPFGLATSIKEEKVGHQSFSKNSSYDKMGSPLDGMKSDALHSSPDGTPHVGIAAAAVAKLSAESVGKSSNALGLVPPPSGRIDSIPPLKPPPGRAYPLPPEPPASLRPPSKAGPPPPSPLLAPSPEKSSGCVGPRPSGPPPPLPVAPSARHGPPPPPPPVVPSAKQGPPPPPPPTMGGPTPPRPPPPLPISSKVAHPPAGSKLSSNAASGEGNGAVDDASAPKTKLKPFFWDKVLANPDHSMVWHQIKSGSFQFNEEMIETLFGYAPAHRNKGEIKKESSQDPSPQYIHILDTKKAQNLSILLRALNVTSEEVCDALYEGNELPAEFIESLLKMAPTADEELKLRLFTGELSELGPAERFLKVLIDIPFAYKRLEALLFMCTMHEEVITVKESFETLEVACKELKNSRLFLKLLEAVLKTGNRMNDGTFRGGAQAFKLDTLLKLSDVKGTDGKTTLLHFVVQEIIRSEGVRAARAAKDGRTLSSVSIKSDDLLKDDISPDTEEEYQELGLRVVSHLSSELENVKKAASVDADCLMGTVAKLGNSLLKTQNFLGKEMKSLNEGSDFHESLSSFVQNAEADVKALLEEEKRIIALVKSTGDYFHGNAGKDEGLRLFVVVRDFLIILDKVCKEVGEAQKRLAKSIRKESLSSSSHPSPPSSQQQLVKDLHSRLFPAIAERHMNYSSSDEES